MINIKNNVSIKNMTTVHIGGVVKYFVDVSSIKELKESINFARNNKLRYFVLGNGSNTLIKDEYYDGVVIRINKKFSNIHWMNNRVEVEAGCLISTFINECRNRGYSCIEKLYGIPGTIGGSVYGNAGANGCCISDMIDNICVLEKNELKIMNVEECAFGYRDSIFKQNKELIIVSVIFNLKKIDKGFIDKSIMLAIKKRRDSQPINKFSFGCTFKNINNISAWKYIKLLNMKFNDDSKVYISDVHSSFIINRGDGTFKDVYNLIESIKNSVYYIYNIRLQEEVEIIDWR